MCINGTLAGRQLQNPMENSLLMDRFSSISVELGCDLIQCLPSLRGYRPFYLTTLQFLIISAYGVCPEFIHSCYTVATAPREGPK